IWPRGLDRHSAIFHLEARLGLIVLILRVVGSGGLRWLVGQLAAFAPTVRPAMISELGSREYEGPSAGGESSTRPQDLRAIAAPGLVSLRIGVHLTGAVQCEHVLVAVVVRDRRMNRVGVR